MFIKFFQNNKKVLIFSSIISLIVSIGVSALVFTIIAFNQAKIFNSLARSSAENWQELSGQNLPASLFSYEAAIIEAVRKAKPSVISIIAIKDVPIRNGYLDLFDFFRFPESQRERGIERREIGNGSAFIITAGGLAITNRHVVSDADTEYAAFTNDGEKYEVEIVAKDTAIDIAVIQLKNGKNFTPLAFGDSDELEVGQTAIAIGNALGEFKNTVSVGVISGLFRSIVARGSLGQAEFLDEVIQTDAAINPGNSGGPLLNIRGEVIGVNVAIAIASENIGFAIPSAIVKNIVSSIEEHGRIVRPFLGVRYVAVTPALQRERNLPVDYGVLVVAGGLAEPSVLPGSPAEASGIKEGDIILEINSEKIKEKSLASLIRRKNVGDTVTLKILRGKNEITVKVTLVEMK